MTVIAFDGKSLAVDGRVTLGGIIATDKFSKMFEVEHPEHGLMVCAIAGSLDFCGPWLDVIKEHGWVPMSIPGMDDDYQMSGLFVDVNGDCWQANTNGSYFKWGKEKAVLGSGTPIAMYCLKKGKSAYNAVVEACEADLFCGGTIKVYNSTNRKITTYERE